MRHHAAFAKFRCGVVRLQIETGRYEKRPLEERKCPFSKAVKSEIHVMCSCNLYEDFRTELIYKASVINPDFNSFSVREKFIFLFSNQYIIKATTKTCFNIIQRRAFYLCK